MGLDAFVYCDCLEKGRVAGVMAEGLHVKIEPDGHPWLYKHGKLVDHDHHDYNAYSCNHTDRILVHHRLGNIGLVSLLRFELQRNHENFPILLEKVVYNGIHANDWLTVDVVKAMQIELEKLRAFPTQGTKSKVGFFAILSKDLGINKSGYLSAKESAQLIEYFREQMLELSEASLSTGKPVAFS